MSTDAFMTLYFIPSPRGFNWDTPTNVARDILKNKLHTDNRYMGHVNIELDYTNSDGKHIHIMTGMTGENMNAPSLILKEKVGLGIILHSFDGKLETKEELDPEYKRRYKKGNKALNFVKFKVNHTTAQRVEQYLADFAKYNISNYYGLVNSPLHGEGAGCSAFGASFMDVAGLMEDEHKKHWTNCIKVPHRLVGGELTNNKVSFLGLVFGQHKWATHDEDHHELFFWDPDLMHKWVEEKITEFHSELSTFSLEKRENVTGIVFDVTHKETPQGPIFKETCSEGKPVSKKPDLKQTSNVNKYD